MFETLFKYPSALARHRDGPLADLQELSENIKPYDRDAVLAFLEILSKAGLEVYRFADEARGVDASPDTRNSATQQKFLRPE